MVCVHDDSLNACMTVNYLKWVTQVSKRWQVKDYYTVVCLSRDYLVAGDNFPSHSTSVRWKILR
jgi:hypothetical protein